MEQQIRFCTTSDGVRIAYATVGKGPPLVRVLGWCTHLEVESQWPDWSRWFLGGLLAQTHLLVRYDGRGMGLSDQNVQAFSLEAKVRDLEAVIDALQLTRFPIVALSEGGPTAIAYTVRHPEQVSRLILYGSFGRPILPDTEEGRQTAETMVSLIRQGWGSDVPAHRQFFTGLFMPDADAASIRAFNELQKASTSPDNVAAMLAALLSFDVTALLPQIQIPTLVIHRRGDAAVPFERGRELAALIPGARFLPLEGRNHAIQADEPENEVLGRAVEEFLSEDRKAARRRPAKAVAAQSGLVTILFTDMEGSTTLTQRLGDAKAQEVLRTHNAIVRDALKACDGSQIKHTGDGVMATFAAASKALECAVVIQKTFEERNRSLSARPEPVEGRAASDEPIRVRIGLNAGEPVAEDEDLFGTAVQLAARICAHAKPGQILASNVVRELAAGKGVMFSDQGEVTLRGFEEPVRLYEVRWG